MPQQPMRPVGRPRQPRQLRTPERKKRYGMIFNENPLPGLAVDEDDDDSTWSMSRSRSSYWMQRQRRQPTMRTRDRSPAQEIIARYRASHSSDDRPHTSSSSATYLQVPSVYGYSYGTRSRTTSGETGYSSQSGPQLRYRQSRAHAMDSGVSCYLVALQPTSLTRVHTDKGSVSDGCPERGLLQHPVPTTRMSQCASHHQRPRCPSCYPRPPASSDQVRSTSRSHPAVRLLM